MMKSSLLHSWNVSPEEAVRIQCDLRSKVIRKNDFGCLKTIAGVDIAFCATSNRAFAGIVVLSFPEMEILEKRVITGTITFPYIPGLLAFREGPLIIKLFRKIDKKPDITLFDGHGLAHPLGCGIASHMGVLLDIPAVGCAKSKLTGTYNVPTDKKGSAENLYDKNRKVIGKVLRSRAGCKPIFVSVGHKIKLITALTVTLQSCIKYRIPGPARLAHMLVNKTKTLSL